VSTRPACGLFRFSTASRPMVYREDACFGPLIGARRARSSASSMYRRVVESVLLCSPPVKAQHPSPKSAPGLAYRIAPDARDHVCWQ